MKITEELSGPIFIIDEEDCNFNSIRDIYNHRFNSYSSGCTNCIKNDIDSNAYVIMSDISLPNFLVVAIEFKDISLDIPLTLNILNEAKNSVKKFYNYNISLNANNIEIAYELKAFILNNLIL